MKKNYIYRRCPGTNAEVQHRKRTVHMEMRTIYERQVLLPASNPMHRHIPNVQSEKINCTTPVNIRTQPHECRPNPCHSPQPPITGGASKINCPHLDAPHPFAPPTPKGSGG
jgi:hypothetical protein